MWIATRELSVFAPIADRSTLELRLAAINDALAKDVASTEPFSPEAVPDVHFMRFVIIPDEQLGGLLAIVVVWWFWALLHAERDDEVAPPPKHAAHTAAELAALEDKIRQNQLTHVVDIKPGEFRAFTVRTVMFVINALAGVFYVDGHLGGITSIHFARWVIVTARRDVPRAQRRVRLEYI